MSALRELGKYAMKTSVGIRGNEEPEPYRVGAYYFREGNGLYIIAGLQTDECKRLFEQLLESLSYSGLGGKRSSGLGRFEWLERNVPDVLERRLQNKGKRLMLLSTAMPKEEELMHVLEDATYSLLRRGGFVNSEKYSDQQMRKRERYVFAAGSCFQNIFSGSVITEKNGGTHPVYRYQKALFLEVET